MQVIEIDEVKFREFYPNHKITETAEEFNISTTSVNEVRKELKIPGKGRGGIKRIRIKAYS